jgi:DNA-binding CsgD family transcriptional regulator
MTNPIALSDNHAFLTSENDMKTICQDHLGQYGIRYFEYLRVYDDGQCIFLSSNQDLTRYIFDNDIPVTAPIQENYIKENFHYFVLPVGDYIKPVHDVKNYFNLSNFFNLVERHPGYINLYCLGAEASNTDIINFYLNKMDVLQNFKRKFDSTAKNLVQTAFDHRVLLPTHMLPTYKGLPSTAKQSQLTKRQTECLYYLTQGMSIKQIAHAMLLSHRTVAHYLDAVKARLGCESRVELFEKARQLNILRENGHYQ